MSAAQRRLSPGSLSGYSFVSYHANLSAALGERGYAPASREEALEAVHDSDAVAGVIWMRNRVWKEACRG